MIVLIFFQSYLMVGTTHIRSLGNIYRVIQHAIRLVGFWFRYNENTEAFESILG